MMKICALIVHCSPGWLVLRHSRSQKRECLASAVGILECVGVVESVL